LSIKDEEMFCLIKMTRPNADMSARRVHHYLHGVNTDASFKEEADYLIETGERY